MSPESMAEDQKARPPRAPKRRRASAAGRTVCPQVIMLGLDDNLLDRSDTPPSETILGSSVNPVLLSPDDGDDDDDSSIHTGFKPPLPLDVASSQQRPSSEPETLEGESDPPQSDESVSDWSGATLIGLGRDPSCDAIATSLSAQPPALVDYDVPEDEAASTVSTEVDRLLAQPSLSVKPEALVDKVTCWAESGPRLRLRVKPPKITPRLKVPEGHSTTQLDDNKGITHGKGKKVVSKQKKPSAGKRKKASR
ncbi:hypothetical protein Z517_00612 [Fonsecaea pedrosoi CBS 271.37]|uniref:Uncharacterized protein n=1 Tax=Fonsecaea pedrosoi CBS 271.37 TaxID=1442368 RepID=A0A0D2FF03_9EURO|nr:uncharacterized protein Z517_00612 [Fonsecaea pedrosoi CBS 271.37]KIW85222.1 hypothetical protein Z517_00612 [Fonsecaea pedrosoi CBS 271.37]